MRNKKVNARKYEIKLINEYIQFIIFFFNQTKKKY